MISRPLSTRAAVAVILACVAAGISLSACVPVDATETLGKIDALRTSASADLVAAKAAGDVKGQERASKTLDALAKAEKVIAAVPAVTDGNGNVDVAKAVGAASALLPPPWNVAAILGGPLVAYGVGEYRRRQARADAVSIVNGLEAAKASNPQLRLALKASEPLIKKEYRPGAVALVKAHKLASE